MSNFPENENNNENLNEINNTKSVESDELSTVFGDPTVHDKKSPKKDKKSRLPIIIASVLAVAVLVGGTVAVVKLIPEKENNSSSMTPVEDIKALDLDEKNFKTVTVTNSNGTFEFYSKTEKKESTSSDTSSDSTTTSWYLTGYDEEVVSSSAIQSIASSAASLNASREITSKSATDCGLDNPKETVKVVTNDGAEFSIQVGDKSPDNSGVYLRLPETDKIYLVDESAVSSFDFELMSLANTTAIAGMTVESDMSNYVTDNKLSSFDSLTVTGVNFEKPVVIEQNTDEKMSQYAQFITTSPTKRIAENVEDLFNLFVSGVSVTGAYSFDSSNESIKKFGLDAPDFAATIKIASHTETFKFKKQDDGNYAVLCSSNKMIKKVASGSLSFIDYKTNDFYSSWVCLQSIQDLSAFTVKTADKEYKFDIVYNSAEDADESYVITYNGKKLTASYFQNFYQYCISLSCADYTVDNISKENDLSIIFTYSDTSKGQSVVNFRKASETKYQYSVDGIEMGKINSSAFNKIEKYAEMVSNNKDVK